MMRVITNAAILAAVSTLACACGGGAELTDASVSSSTCEAQDQWSLTAPGQRFQGALAHDGGYVVVRSEDGSKNPTAVLSLDTIGNTRWETNLAQRWGKLVASSSGLVVAGSIGAQPDVEVTALSAGGAPLWSALIATEEEDFVRTVVVDGDSIVIVGESSPYASDGDQILVARIGPGGSVEWVRTFGEINSSSSWHPIEKPFGAFLDAKGRVVIGSKRWLNGGGGPPWIFAVTREGDIAWEYTEDIEFERGSSWVLLPTKDGGSLVTGTLPSGGFSGPTRALRLDAEGALLWSLSLDDGSGDQQLVEAALETESSEIVLAGYSQSSTEARVWWVSPGGALVRSIDYEKAGGPFQLLRAMPGGGYLLGSTSAGDPETTGAWHLLRISSAGHLLWGYDVISDGYPYLGDVVVAPGGDVLAVGSWTFDNQAIGRILAFNERCVIAP